MVSAIGKGRQGVEHVSGSSWEKNTKAECWRGPRKQCLKKKKKKKKKDGAHWTEQQSKEEGLSKAVPPASRSLDVNSIRCLPLRLML